MSKPFFSGLVSVLENHRIAQDTYRIRLRAPELARAIAPGQFLMIKLHGSTDPLLGRPFALYDTVVDGTSEPIALEVVYLVVGKLTGRLAALGPGDRVDAWGPLGNGFPDLSGKKHVGLVAGGIGQTPFLAHIRALLGQRSYAGRPAKRQVEQVSLYYGARSHRHLAGVADFQAAGATVHLATDDGSAGHHGFVTQLLASQKPPDHLVGCGPEPMMRALARLASSWKVSCHLSLETPMACGIGICFSCVTAVRTTEEAWDYRRVCVEGPIFDAAELAWDVS